MRIRCIKKNLLYSFYMTLSLSTLLILGSCSDKNSLENKQEQRVDSLIGAGRDSLFSDIPAAKKYLQEAMNRTKDSMKYYDAFEAYSSIYYLENKYDSGLLMKQKTLAFLEKQPKATRRQELMASVYNAIGVYYAQMNKPDSAIIFLQKSLQCPPSIESKPDLYINLSDQYKFKGDLPTATYYLRLGLAVSDSFDLDKFKFPIYLGLGDIYLGLRDFKRADEYYLRAEKDYPNRKFNEKVIFSNNRGNYYYYKKEYRKSLACFKRAEKDLESTNYDFFKNMVYGNISDVYLNLNQLDSCKYYYEKAEPYFKSINHKTILYYINATKIGVAVAENNFALARKLQQEIKSDEGIEPNILSIRTEYLEKLALNTSDYKSAYQYLKKRITVNDSLRDDATQQRIADLDMQYNQDSTLMKKDLIIQKKSAEAQTFKLSTYLWILISLVGLISAIFGYYIIKKRNNMQRMKFIEQISNLRIGNIRNRISPHFMFNVLNNEMQGVDEEKKQRLFTLIHLLRKSLEMTEETSIMLIDEIDFAKTYIELNKQKVGDNLTVSWDISEHVDLNNARIIPMMLQIPIENALKHGFPSVEGEKKLSIKMLREEEGIRIFVTDNGKGYHPNGVSSPTSTGTGLRVLNQTLQILNARNRQKAVFLIQNIGTQGETGTKVEIFIPHHYKYEYK